MTIRRQSSRCNTSSWGRSTVLMVAAAIVIPSSNLLAQEQPIEPSAEAETGYFPTIAEDTLLRGAADSRSWGRGRTPSAIQGPDGPAQNATGLFRYYDNNPDFYERNLDFFRPINQGLGLFTPRDAWTLESRRQQYASLTFDAELGLLTRTFEPELAHVKAGPLYFDLLWVGAGMIYSDYNGTAYEFEGDDEDGFNAYIDVGLRGMLRITDSIYLSAVASIMYLPFENEVALRFGNSGVPPVMLQFVLQDEVADWELIFYDQFRGITGLDFLVNADSPAFDRSGRYTFGFIGDRSDDFFERDNVYFVNEVGIGAARPVFGNQWRYGLNLSHSDFWKTFSFDDHGTRDALMTWLQYEGSILPFAPRFSYQYTSNDGYRSLLHQVRTQFTGRLTENLSWGGMVGYAFTTGDTRERDGMIWQVDLDHTITRTTFHSLTFGQGYHDNEFVAETIRSDYARYIIDQRITARLGAAFFAQYSHREEAVGSSFPMRDRFGAGFRMAYHPLDFTELRAFVYYEQYDQNSTVDDASRWIYRFDVTQQLAFRLTAKLFYQYEELSAQSGGFNEHFCGVSLRRYF